jgi:hypothetical protein
VATSTAAKNIFPAQDGYLSTFGIFSNASSQLARLAQNICEFGLIGISVLRLPAGTTINWPFLSTLGNADPQIEQKHLPWRVEGRLKRVTLLSPEIQFSFAAEENRFAA